MTPVATRRGFFLTSAAIVAFSFGVELRRVIPSDTGFLLYVAGRVLDGARLYVDIVEINPPLVVGLNLPVVLASRALSIPEILVHRLAVTALLLVCIGLTSRILGRLFPAGDELRRRWTLLLLTLVLFLLCGAYFNEREHLMLALISPYLMLAAVRAEKHRISAPEAAGVGALAGLGFALKPHFLLIFLAVEAYLQVRRRTAARIARPETLALAGVLLAYGVAVLVVTPDYVRMVRLLGGTYLEFMYAPFLRLLVTGPGVVLSWFAVLAWVALSKHLRSPALGEVLVVAVVGALFAGAAQQKGFPYHFFPSWALALVLLGMLVADSWNALRGVAERLYHVLAAAVLSTAAIVAVVQGSLLLAGRAPSGGEPELMPLSRLVREEAEGQPIFVMSYHIESAFPLINYSGAVLGSRFHHFWILAADYLTRLKSPEPLQYRMPEEMPATERYLNEAVLADLQRYRPRLLIVLRNARDDPGNGYRRFDYIRYFERDPRFARIFSQYQELDTVGNYVVYERVTGSQSRLRPPPTAAPGTQDLRRRRADALGIGLWSPTFLLRLGVFVTMIAGFTILQLVKRAQRSESAPEDGM